MHRRLFCAGLALVLAGLNAQAADFTASLDGAQEVPPVTTNATGSASFVFLNVFGNERLITVRTNTRLSSRISDAHLHNGPVGEDGPIVLDLSVGALVNNSFLGITVSTEDQLTGPLDGLTFADLQAEMTAGDIYINVHTTTNPDGEIRGQLEASEG